LNDSNKPKGIPYYLPKPYLIISKNIRYIPTPTVGLTQTVPIPSTFDGSAATPIEKGTISQNGTNTSSKGTQDVKPSKPPTSTNTATLTSGGKQGAGTGKAPKPTPGTPKKTATETPTSAGTDKSSVDSNSGTAYGSQVFGPASIAVVPPASISDGLIPQEFYTYQIVYIPDLTQKYGLRIKGGSGEFRATENFVNGWMHTGPGPFYMRDSFTAQSVQAVGQAVSDIGGTLGQVALSAMGVPSFPKASGGTNAAAKLTSGAGTTISDYAQIFVFEPVLTKHPNAEATVEWRQLAGLPSFKREWIELERTASDSPPIVTEPVGNKVVSDCIGASLIKAGWTVTSIRATIDDTAGPTELKMTIEVKGISGDKAKPDLEKDARTAAESCDDVQALGIRKDNIHILVKAQIG